MRGKTLSHFRDGIPVGVYTFPLAFASGRPH